MRALLLCALGCPAPEDKPADTIPPDDTETTPSDTASPESTPTSDTSTPSTDTYVTPIPDPCDSWTEPADTGLPAHLPVADVATATATGPHTSAYLGYSLAVWDGHLYAGQPNYASYELTGIHVFSLPELALVGAWRGEGDEAVGSSVAASDIDGDGLVEVAIGSIFGDGTGSVSLVRGTPDGTEQLLQADDLVFYADEFAASAGADVLFASLGPDPEQIDLIVSGDGDTYVQGAVWALDPDAQGSLGESDALRTIRGARPFGAQIAALDLDLDGLLDLASAMSDGIGWFRGPWVVDLAEGDRDGVWTGSVETNLGWMLESLGDVTGDGGDDLGFSASMSSIDAERAGRAYLVEGGELPPDGPVDDIPTRFHGVAVGDGMGWAMASGDLDGDGQLDLLVSASGVYPGEWPGQVLVYPGPVCPAIRTADDAAVVLVGEVVYDYFGRTLLTTDFDADGLDDVLIGAHGAPGGYGDGVIYAIPASSLAW
jgi:hypothetical protein